MWFDLVRYRPVTMTEAELIGLTFAEVYQTQAPRVYAYCLSQVGNPVDAEDLAADVFAAAFAAYSRVRPSSSGVQPWLIRIAHNACVDHLRRTRRRAFASWFTNGRNPEPASPIDVERDAVLRDELRFVLSRMCRLRRRDQLLVGLRVAADLSYAEIGEVLGISEHAATMGVRRALERLRHLCEEAA